MRLQSQTWLRNLTELNWWHTETHQYFIYFNALSHPTLCHSMDFTFHGILQARILEWVPLTFFRGSSLPRDQIHISYIASRFFSSWAITETQEYWSEAYPFSSTSSQPRNWVEIPCIAGGFFTSWAARESQHTQRVRVNQGSKLFISIVMFSICIYFMPSVIWAVHCTVSIKTE